MVAAEASRARRREQALPFVERPFGVRSAFRRLQRLEAIRCGPTAREASRPRETLNRRKINDAGFFRQACREESRVQQMSPVRREALSLDIQAKFKELRRAGLTAATGIESGAESAFKIVSHSTSSSLI
jgi:hypothetical protein